MIIRIPIRHDVVAITHFKRVVSNLTTGNDSTPTTGATFTIFATMQIMDAWITKMMRWMDQYSVDN